MATNSSDRKTIQWPVDSTRVNIDDPVELEFWSQRFHVGVGMLKQAVQIVGAKFKDVEFHLNSRRNNDGAA